MAGVIASVSLQQDKESKSKKQVNIHKSNYIIPQFDQHFQPGKHNIFYQR